MSEDIIIETTDAPTNVVAMPTPETAENAPTEAPAASEAASKPEPKNIQELIANIDIKGVTEHEIIVDLIAGIQQLAVRGTIALGLLERMAAAQESADPAPETPAAE